MLPAPFLHQVLPSGKLSVKVMVTIHQIKPFHSRDSEHWLYTTRFDSIDKNTCDNFYISP